MLRPPKHLTEQIQALRAPIRHLNHEFIKSLVDKMPLRPDLDPDAIIRYLGSIEPFFPNIVANYQDGQTAKDFHAILESVGEVLNIVLFGMLRQTEQKEFSKFNPASEGRKLDPRRIPIHLTQGDLVMDPILERVL